MTKRTGLTTYIQSITQYLRVHHQDPSRYSYSHTVCKRKRLLMSTDIWIWQAIVLHAMPAPRDVVTPFDTTNMLVAKI
jgi:hypothetical protein